MSASDRVRTGITEEAAEWFVANRAGPADGVERATFVTWLKTSPVHVEEYLGVASIARELRLAASDDPDLSLESLLARARSPQDSNVRPIGALARPSEARPALRRWRFAAAAATVAAAALATLWWYSGDRAVAVRYATRHGEQITQRLADNSVLHLDSDTAVTVRFSRTRRLVQLERGQALFEVAHEAGRAFQVIAGAAEVVDVGTSFDVYLQRDSTLVTVLEGAVAVSLAPGEPGASAAPGRAVPVRAGEQIRVSGGTLPERATPADTQHRTAWLHRQIVFEEESLEAVAAEFNRYSTTPIEIETPALRALEISGTFSTDDTESFVAFLKSLSGVTVEVTPTRIRVSRIEDKARARSGP
jgi:transmembrane sensor